MPDRTLTIEGSAPRCDAANFLRGFSIFTIVLMHLVQNYFPDLPPLLYQAAALGGTGAHVFIFCSGFGLYRSRLRRPLTVGQFMFRRLGKVYLPYLPVVLASACVPALCAGVDRVGAVAAHVLLYKMFVPRYIESLGMQFWFVSTIIQLYLLFLPLCRLRERLGVRGLMLIGIGVSAAWWIILAATGLYVERVWNSFCAQFLWEFVLGMAAAEYLHRGGTVRLRRRWLGAAAVIGLGLQAGIALLGGYPLRLFNDVPGLFGYGALALLLYSFGADWFRSIFRGLSTISYPWYLMHILVFTLVFTLSPGGLAAQIGLGVAAFALSLLAAWGYSALIGYIRQKFGSERI